ncbi:MAG: hypothetical protein QXD43_03030 [Candidatus Aenigmatarchaeota archaeon]
MTNKNINFSCLNTRDKQYSKLLCNDNIEKESEEIIKQYLIVLFIKLLKTLTNSQIFFRKIVSFSFLWSFFSYHHITKYEAKKIIKMWAQMGLCEIVRLHGIKVNVNSDFIKLSDENQIRVRI